MSQFENGSKLLLKIHDIKTTQDWVSLLFDLKHKLDRFQWQTIHQQTFQLFHKNKQALERFSNGQDGKKGKFLLKLPNGVTAHMAQYLTKLASIEFGSINRELYSQTHTINCISNRCDDDSTIVNTFSFLQKIISS